jgi:hypothetical protein
MFRDERLARNEAAAREINEGIEHSLRLRTEAGHVRMLCECGEETCETVIAITIDEYEGIRSAPRHFAVAKGHVIPGIEFPVRETDRFVVVEKRDGIPAEVAEEEDPRD